MGGGGGIGGRVGGSGEVLPRRHWWELGLPDPKISDYRVAMLTSA